MSLNVLDIMYTVLHYVVIGINMFAWIPSKTRKLHLVTVVLTLSSWVLLGFWKGFGYCFLTDWQWEIKRQMGERNLPNSFIHYQLVEVFQLNIRASTTNNITIIVFFIMVLITFRQHLLKDKIRHWQYGKNHH